MKKVLKIVAGLAALLLVIVICYVGYVFISYKRLPDQMSLSVADHNEASLEKSKSYDIMSYNIGYAAYPADYSFFMDGGKYSRAYDKATVEDNMAGILKTTKALDPDLALFQEVDQDGDRSQHVDEVAGLQKGLAEYSNVYAQNYDSAYLFYPVTDPIGKAKSGLLTFAKAHMTESTRYSLPIDTDFNKFFDLDRAFSATKIPVTDGRTLTLINLHMSAFTKNRDIRQAQLDKLFNFMKQEYENGHHVIVGGDFNHDMLGNSPEVFGTQTEPFNWTHAFPIDQLPAHFRVATDGLAEAKIPSVRRNNEPYKAGSSFVSIVDGFLVSDNVSVEKVAVHDQGFANSDHNPIVMTFQLK